jgi:hypothetical protein
MESWPGRPGSSLNHNNGPCVLSMLISMAHLSMTLSKGFRPIDSFDGFSMSLLLSFLGTGCKSIAEARPRFPAQNLTFLTYPRSGVHYYRLAGRPARSKEISMFFEVDVLAPGAARSGLRLTLSPETMTGSLANTFEALQK